VARRFEDLKIPAKIMVTDYYDHCEVVCEQGDLRRAVAASAAIPAVFRPVMLDDRVMIDGGIFNPVPFDRLAGLADIIIGIDVVGLPSGVPGKPPSTIDMMFGASQLMMQSIIGMKCQTNPPHILLRPEVHQFRVLDFLKAVRFSRSPRALPNSSRTTLMRLSRFSADWFMLGSAREGRNRLSTGSDWTCPQSVEALPLVKADCEAAGECKTTASGWLPSRSSIFEMTRKHTTIEARPNTTAPSP
jgi:hypothetical protein